MVLTQADGAVSAAVSNSHAARRRTFHGSSHGRAQRVKEKEDGYSHMPKASPVASLGCGGEGCGGAGVAHSTDGAGEGDARAVMDVALAMG